MEKNLKIYIYSLNHFAVYLTLTQHCKSTVFQFLKIAPKKKIYIETENGLVVAQGREKTGINSGWRDFPVGPVVKTLPSNAGDVGSVPGQGSKVPHAMAYGQKFFLIRKNSDWM